MKITWELMVYTVAIIGYGMFVGWMLRGESDKELEDEKRPKL